MRGFRLVVRMILAAVPVAALSLSGCTTTIQPVRCQGGPYRCSEGSRDVKFCENEVIASEGADCGDLGLAASKHFCIVKREDDTCADNRYELKGRACTVRQYRAVREWRECSAGTPTFAP
jgi:hypothetical protein